MSRRIGVLGGMGPAATIDFYTKLVEQTPAGRDQEHLPVVIWADPGVPDRSDNLLGTGEDPTPWLQRGIDALVDAGCDLLAVPCNTAHAFVPPLARAAGLELVSIVEVAADHLAATGVRAAGLLATTGTVHSRLYADALARRGIATVEPSPVDQERVMDAIVAVKAGRSGPAQSRALVEVSSALAARRAQRVVAACTEIVLALGGAAVGLPVVDPARLLARRVVDLALSGATTSGPASRSGCAPPRVVARSSRSW